MVQKSVKPVLCVCDDVVGKVTRRACTLQWCILPWWSVHTSLGGYAFRDLITINHGGLLVIGEGAVRSHRRGRLSGTGAVDQTRVQHLLHFFRDYFAPREPRSVGRGTSLLRSFREWDTVFRRSEGAERPVPQA